MTVTPIKDNSINISINYPDIDVVLWRELNTRYKNKTDVEAIEDLLKYLDWYYYNSITYKEVLKGCYYYLLHITNPFLYNKYLDKIINIHKIYTDYDIIEQYIKKTAKEKQKINNIKQTKPKNKYYKVEFKDIFTGEIKYDYINPVTKDKISSTNPDLLEILNNKKKKEKKIKVTSIPLDMMTFSFNNKKKT